jgi:hypothetical protein
MTGGNNCKRIPISEECNSVVQHLHSVQEALGSIPALGKKKKEFL